ncbi:D-allose transporter substrate-binding protein [Proteiniclasticum sp. QWL-01]|uniref:D-allose transporter substrate-binding protein n=1 Tax=Proteiniclasticum sp. QWL-01 TaxID=3036945 RepID=UPI00220CEE81|nr:D-allose transporter substrate-binding protein [Proteiniclasticum sp. QWL-01]UUM12818.1 D-allose transporter substrate-binding protein [Clostridiaceae bacterium HFYG-1003]WFF74375.1 D-allose transporter substrate-binding protein [Proteiniclasticum sp. QWL-01]
MKKALSILSASVLSISLLAACTPAAPATTAGGTTPGTTPSTTTAAAGEVTYAVLLKNQSSDFWVKMKQGVEAKAKELNVKVDILAAQSEEDTEGQLKILESLVNGGYAAIGVAPLSPVNLIPAVVSANQKGIYVMNIDEKLDMAQLKAQGGAVIGFATTDNVAVGKKGAEFINGKIEKGSKVAIIEGKAGNTSGEARKQGATEAFTAAGMTIVGSLPGDWDRQKALDVAASYIQQNADLKAIYCANDTMALGALQAVINANKLGSILVVGTDGDTEAVKSVEDGQLAATIAQDPAMIGAKSLEEMVNAVKNKITVDPNAEPKLIPIDSLVISK